MKFVFDSSPLIHLAKAGLSWSIRKLEGKKFTVPSVYTEVVETGMTRGFDDAPITRGLIEDKVLVVRKPQDELVKALAVHRDIHRGEAEAMALTEELGAIIVIDDPVARRICTINGLKKEGTYGVILRMVRLGELTKPEAADALGSLVTSGWRCSAVLYERLIRLVNDL